MSAREEFENWLKKWDVSHAVALPEKLQAVLDEHGHELAEKIRQRADRETLMYREEFKDAVWQGLHRAADIIDPPKE